MSLSENHPFACQFGSPGRFALPRRAGCAGAFSLIELLCALAVLLVIVGLMAMIFSKSEDMRTATTGKMEARTAAQAALDMLSRDLEGAIADVDLPLAMHRDRSNGTSYGFLNDEISFLSLAQDSTGDVRHVRELKYWVQPMTNAAGHPLGRYELIRACRTCPAGARSPYDGDWTWVDDRPAPSNCASLLENVAGLGFVAPDSTGTISQVYFASVNGDGLPEYMDILLDVLDETTAKQAADLSSRGSNGVALAEALVDRKLYRFTTRVHFPLRNRELP